jgi:hypothetical protein
LSLASNFALTIAKSFSSSSCVELSILHPVPNLSCLLVICDHGDTRLSPFFHNSRTLNPLADRGRLTRDAFAARRGGGKSSRKASKTNHTARNGAALGQSGGRLRRHAPRRSTPRALRSESHGARRRARTVPSIFPRHVVRLQTMTAKGRNRAKTVLFSEGPRFIANPRSEPTRISREFSHSLVESRNSNRDTAFLGGSRRFCYRLAKSGRFASRAQPRSGQ